MGNESNKWYVNGIFAVALSIGGAGLYIGNDALAAPGPSQNRLYAEKGCVACHDLNARKLGPSFKAIAKRYSVKDKAKLADRILNGSTGSWGSVPMPATKGMGVTRADADNIVNWILIQK